MRKNRMMRLASALLILTMVTTCAISGTFAKYVTADSATDTARVAKWGVKVDVTGETAFAEAYGAGNTAVEKTDANATVVSSGTATAKTVAEVVAPGTAGSFGSVTISGEPEVDVEVAVGAALTLGDGWTVTVAGEDKFYCPLVIGGVNGADAQYLGNKDKFVNDVLAQFTVATTHVEANTNLANTYNKAANWSWAIDGNDTYDTELGDNAADGEELWIEFSISATVTQVD